MMCFKIFRNGALEIFYCTLRGTLHDLRRNHFNQNFSLFTLAAPSKPVFIYQGGPEESQTHTHTGRPLLLRTGLVKNREQM